MINRRSLTSFLSLSILSCNANSLFLYWLNVGTAIPSTPYILGSIARKHTQTYTSTIFSLCKPSIEMCTFILKKLICIYFIVMSSSVLASNHNCNHLTYTIIPSISFISLYYLGRRRTLHNMRIKTNLSQVFVNL